VSLKKKTIGTLCFAIFFSSSIGIFLDVLINENVVQILISASLLFSLPMYFLCYKNRHNVAIAYQKKGKIVSNWAIVLSVIVAIPSLTILLLAKGLPSVLHYVSSSQSKMVVTVENTYGSYRSKYCNGEVLVKEFKYSFIINTVCINDQALWSSLKRNDKLTLIGRKSLIGFSYSEFKKS
jgi:hypothetical protein